MGLAAHRPWDGRSRPGGWRSLSAEQLRLPWGRLSSNHVARHTGTWVVAVVVRWPTPDDGRADRWRPTPDGRRPISSDRRQATDEQHRPTESTRRRHGGGPARAAAAAGEVPPVVERHHRVRRQGCARAAPGALRMGVVQETCGAFTWLLSPFVARAMLEQLLRDDRHHRHLRESDPADAPKPDIAPRLRGTRGMVAERICRATLPLWRARRLLWWRTRCAEAAAPSPCAFCAQTRPDPERADERRSPPSWALRSLGCWRAKAESERILAQGLWSLGA